MCVTSDRLNAVQGTLLPVHVLLPSFIERDFADGKPTVLPVTAGNARAVPAETLQRNRQYYKSYRHETLPPH